MKRRQFLASLVGALSALGIHWFPDVDMDAATCSAAAQFGAAGVGLPSGWTLVRRDMSYDSSAREPSLLTTDTYQAVAEGFEYLMEVTTREDMERPSTRITKKRLPVPE